MVDILKANEKAHPYSEKVNNNDSENTYELPAGVQTVINRYLEKVLWSYFSDLDRVSDGNNPFTYQDQLIV